MNGGWSNCLLKSRLKKHIGAVSSAHADAMHISQLTNYQNFNGSLLCTFLMFVEMKGFKI